jgi:hypothetical protein
MISTTICHKRINRLTEKGRYYKIKLSDLNKTSKNLPAGVVDTRGKFATGDVDTGGAP